MERITDKLKKLLALAERGCGGEAENARRLLEEHLRKYGMTLEDICENNISRRTFKSQFNKEKKRLMKDILHAFVNKHNIFDCTPNDDDKASDKEIDLEELMRILSLSNGMEDVTYRKAISNK